MRIRPAVVTAAASVVALAAVATVVLATTPQDAEPGLIRLLWVALVLAGWGMAATLLLVLRQSLPQAVWAGFPVGAGTALLVWFLHRGMLSQRLLLTVILITLGISFVTWWRLRRHRNPHD